MSSEDKIQLKVYVTRRTIDNFKRFLSQKWHTYGRGLLSLEVEQALIRYISGERAEHTHSSGASDEANHFYTMKGRKLKPRRTYSIKELDQLKATTLSVADLIDKKIKGEKIERDHTERAKATLLKEEIIEWLISSGKYEQRELVKQVPISLLRQAIGAIKEIKDKRSISNQIEYLKIHNQIDQIGLSGKQYRFLG
jgi:hypothetical protein